MNGSVGTWIPETMDFEGLAIRFDERVLRPRPWTGAQSRWAAALLEDLPPGPVLELCAGAGHLGLAAVIRSRRRLVCVERDSVAGSFAVLNATAAGVADRIEVRTADLSEALAPDEEFVLVLADPPWVPGAEVRRYPEDPVTAIDGGPDGLDVARRCVHVIGAHLDARGSALLQLGTAEQAERLGAEIAEAGLETSEVRGYDGGVVVRLDASARRRPC